MGDAMSLDSVIGELKELQTELRGDGRHRVANMIDFALGHLASLSNRAGQIDALAKYILDHFLNEPAHGMAESPVECAIRIMGEQAEQIRRVGIYLSGLRSAARAVVNRYREALDNDEEGMGELLEELERELDAQAYNQETGDSDLLLTHLYECGHVWRQEGKAPEGCPVCALDGQAAAMIRALELCRDWFQEDYPATLSVQRGADLRAEEAKEYAILALESNAGARMLAALEAAQEVARVYTDTLDLDYEIGKLREALAALKGGAADA